MRISYGPEGFFQKHGGISKYFTRIADGVAGKGHSVGVIAPLFLTEGLKDLSHAQLEGALLTADSKWLRSVLRTGSILKGRATIARRKPDIFHPTYYSLLDVLPSPAKTVLTVYDFVHEKIGGRSVAEKNLTILRKRAAIHRADLILAISENTRNDLLELFPRIDPATVIVTPLGVETNPYRPPAEPVHKDNRTILWVGPRGRYKNFQVVIAALKFLSKALLEDTNLVVFGGEPLTGADVQELVDSGLQRRSISQEFGDDAKLADHYRNARMLLYTSKYEGFGLPILEAMANGCPVICSAVSSMPEVAGNAGLLVNPESPEQVAAAIKELMENDDTWLRLQREGLERADIFSWEACIEKTERAYLSVLD